MLPYRELRAAVSRLAEPRLGRSDVVGTALGGVLGIGLAAGVLACFLAFCPLVLDRLLS